MISIRKLIICSIPSPGLLICWRYRSEGDSLPGQPNLRGVHELSYSSEPAPKMDEVKGVITLRSSKEIEQPVSKPVEKANQEKEMESDQIIIKEDSMKKRMPP